MSRRWTTIALAAALMAGCGATQTLPPKTGAAEVSVKEQPSRFQPMPMITYYQPVPYGPMGDIAPAGIDRRQVDLGAK